MMYYFAVVILLNRPFIINEQSGDQNEAAKRCTEAARAVLEIARVVRVDDIMHFGHTCGKYYHHILPIEIAFQLNLATFAFRISLDSHASVLYPSLQRFQDNR
jgi:hypothetical protein